MDKKLTLEEFLERVAAFKEKGGVDLSAAEDLSIAVMNLVSLEEHFFFTGVKTKKDEYFDFAKEVRDERKKLLAQLMPTNEGETWCIAKHLLATTMRLVEVGTRHQADGDKKRAKEVFETAYKVYSLFWAVKIGLVSGEKKVENNMSPLEELVGKLADCCSE